MNKTFTNVEEYIQSFSTEVRILLQEIRACVQKAAPEATESISYGMPAYKINGKPLVYFAAFKNHLGFYATPTGHAAFTRELAHYKQGKGSVQFPYQEPLPLDLIHRIVIYRLGLLINDKKNEPTPELTNEIIPPSI